MLQAFKVFLKKEFKGLQREKFMVLTSGHQVVYNNNFEDPMLPLCFFIVPFPLLLLLLLYY